MSLIPNSYEELLEKAGNYGQLNTYQSIELINNLGLGGLQLDAQAPVFYIVDYTTKKYLFIDPSCKKLLGYDIEFLSEAGLIYFTGLWNKNDFTCINEKVIPEAISFLKHKPVTEYPNFSVSYNYRVQAANGQYLSVMQRSTYFSVSNDGWPLAAVGYIVDITHFKTDTSLVLTIEHVDRNFTTLSKVPLVKKIYYPDKVDSILSNRELEILSAVKQGMASKEIASRFYLSVNTVNNHRKNMLQKTKTNNSSELIEYARSNGLI